MAVVLYVILFFMVLRFVVTLFNFMSDPKLRRVLKPYPDLISILIPVRNEQDNILTLLNSILEQDYQNYEVIILDDDSTDNTWQLCAEFAAKYSQFSIIKGETLPPDWLGKNYACYQLAKKAKGNYLLFLDADEQVRPGLINSAVHRMYLKNLGLLTLFANQKMKTLGERTVVPMMHFILLNLLPLQLVYLIRNRSVAAASGQFMLFNAEHYRRHQWHEQARQSVVEDVEIMRLVKGAGYNGEALLANNLLCCRMYKSYPEAMRGFSKNFLAAFNYNVFALLIYLMIVIGGPLIVIATLNINLIVFMCGLIILPRIMISLAAGQNVLLNILLHPIQLFNLMLTGFISIQQHLTKTTVWKGRRV